MMGIESSIAEFLVVFDCKANGILSRSKATSVTVIRGHDAWSIRLWGEFGIYISIALRGFHFDSISGKDASFIRCLMA